MLPRKTVQARHSPTQETELVQRLRAGDRAAQAEVVRRYRRVVMHQAFAVLRQWTLAEDVVQDTWILVFKNIEHFQGRSKLRTWIVGIAINRARRYRRQQQRSPPFSALVRDSDDSVAAGSPPESTPLSEPVDDVSAEDMMVKRERRDALKNALRRLPVTQRSVLVLQLQGYSPSETRNTLRISEVARRVRLSRARARLRKVIHPGMPPHP